MEQDGVHNDWKERHEGIRNWTIANKIEFLRCEEENASRNWVIRTCGESD